MTDIRWVVLCLTLSGCHSVGPLGPDAVKAAGPNAQTGDVVVRPDQFGETISMSLSQTLSVPRPVPVDEWRISYATEVLSLVTPQEKVRAPGPEGWRFRSSGIGETDLVFTTIPPPCPGDTPCSPPPPRQFSLTVHVSR